MKLYHHPASPNCRKVRVTAALLGIRLEERLIDLPVDDHKKLEYI